MKINQPFTSKRSLKMRINFIYSLLLSIIMISTPAYADTYIYDSLGRLTRVTYADASSISYSYDSNGNRQSRVISINLPPTAANDSATTPFETPVTIDVAANDSDANGTIDLTSVVIVTNATNGTTSINATTGVVTYTPNAGFSGGDTFTYTINDDLGDASNVAAVTITVQPEPPNQAPVANNDSASTNHNAAITISVTSNDTDADGTIDTGSVVVVTASANGSTTVNSNGSITFTPTTGYSGTTTFTYTVADDDGTVSNVATVTVTVRAAVVTPPPSSGGGGGGGSSGIILISLLTLVLIRRRYLK